MVLARGARSCEVVPSPTLCHPARGCVRPVAPRPWFLTRTLGWSTSRACCDVLQCGPPGGEICGSVFFPDFCPFRLHPNPSGGRRWERCLCTAARRAEAWAGLPGGSALQQEA